MEEVSGNTLKGYGLEGSLIGNPPIVQCVYGKGMSFDGHSQALALGSHFGTCFGDVSLCPLGYTLSFWFKYGTSKSHDTGNQYFISGGAQTKSSHGIAIFLTGGTFKVVIKKPSGLFWQIITYLSMDWNHVTITWQQKEGLRMYVNGTKKMETNEASLSPLTEVLDLGIDFGRPNSGKTRYELYGNFFIDEILFWERAITSEWALDIFDRYHMRI